MQKRTIIKKIRAIIKEHGGFTTGTVMAESSPSIKVLMGVQLCESFYLKDVEVVSYDKNDEEIDSERIPYEDLDKDVLEEILILAEEYEAMELQDEDRQGGY